MTKKRFNMIEVVLALGITAVGIVGILAVFPVGLKTANKAIAESYVADLANGFLDNLEAEGKGWIGNITTTKPTPTQVTDTDDLVSPEIVENANYDSDPNGAYKKGDTLEKRTIYVLSDGQIDFAVDRICWKADPNPRIVGTDGTLVTQETVKLVRVYVEYSWPISAPYADREKRLFVREFLLE